jgi:hypothetical protein
MKSVRMMGIAALSLTIAWTTTLQAQQEVRIGRFDKSSRPEQASLRTRLPNGNNLGVGLIPNDRYRSHFGPAHKFHLNSDAYGQDRVFQYGGYSFAFVDEWPTNWLPSEDVFVVQIEGEYYLGNSTYPGVNIPLHIAKQSESSGKAVARL